MKKPEDRSSSLLFKQDTILENIEYYRIPKHHPSNCLQMLGPGKNSCNSTVKEARPNPTQNLGLGLTLGLC